MRTCVCIIQTPHTLIDMYTHHTVKCAPNMRHIIHTTRDCIHNTKHKIRYPKLDSHYVFKWMCNTCVNANSTYSGRYTHYIAKRTPNKRHIIHTTCVTCQLSTFKIKKLKIRHVRHPKLDSQYVLK